MIRALKLKIVSLLTLARHKLTPPLPPATSYFMKIGGEVVEISYLDYLDFQRREEVGGETLHISKS